MEEDPMIQVARGAVETLQRLNEAFLREAAHVLVGFGETVSQMHDWMWDRYRKAGMPYGDSDEDMLLWFKQIASNITETV